MLPRGGRLWTKVFPDTNFGEFQIDGRSSESPEGLQLKPTGVPSDPEIGGEPRHVTFPDNWASQAFPAECSNIPRTGGVPIPKCITRRPPKYPQTLFPLN
jgi:hypothetical protein